MPCEHGPGKQFHDIQGTFLVPNTADVILVESSVRETSVVYTMFLYNGGDVRKRSVKIVLDSVSEQVWARRVEPGKRYLAVQGPFSDADIRVHALKLETVFDVFTLVSVLDKNALTWLAEKTNAG